MVMDPVVHEHGDNIGDEMLNVSEDVIGPTHELPTEDEHVDNFDTDPLQREKYDEMFAKMEAKLYPGCYKFSSLNFFGKVDAFKSAK